MKNHRFFFVRKICQIIACALCFLLLSSTRLWALSGPPPITNSPSGGGVLDSWSFNDTTYWTSDDGYYPISYSNIGLSGLGPGNDLLIDTNTAAWLKYNVYESGGSTNLNVVSDGSVMFWFAPNWESANDTNGLGTGPGVWSRLLEIGQYTSGATYGWWSLYMDNLGNTLNFVSQDALGDQASYLTAPVTFESNVWHLIALTWTPTNTSLFVDGVCLTNGPGISALPSSTVLSQGFTIGSDAATGIQQMHGSLSSLVSYDWALDSGSVSAEWVLDGIFYFLNPDNLGNFENPPYYQGTSDIYDVVSGPGYLQVLGTNTTSCFTNSNVWVTNAAVTLGTNNSINMSFMVIGGDPDLPYDVFATTYLRKPLTNGIWAWMGQAYPCQTNVINGLTNGAVYLILGTPQDSDGDGLTDAFELLITHTNPYSPDSAGDGIADGWKLLDGMPITSTIGIPSLNSVTAPCCPIP
jgi:hypothetical protein